MYYAFGLLFLQFDVVGIFFKEAPKGHNDYIPALLQFDVVGIFFKEVKRLDDQFYMQLALELARGTKGQTSPNPQVGAVVVNQGRIVGMGAHLKAGEAHAEVQALNMAGNLAKGSTIYVTLEPCSHYGKTPPCAEKIIQEQVKRVVIASSDPNPLVSGRGISLIEQAGIEVATGVMASEAASINESFNKFITTGIPFVTVKTAMTLDGKIATHSGSSKWITGEPARNHVHQLRHEHDAIMVGIGTVLKDNPSLTVRGEQQGINPLRVIVDSKLAIPLTAKVLTDGEAPTWIFTTTSAEQGKIAQLTDLGVKVVVTRAALQVNLQEVLQHLGTEQVTSVFVEGGGTLIGSLFTEQLIDKYLCFLAPKLVGGRNAPTAIAGEGVSEMSAAVSLERITIRSFGEDYCITGYPNWK